MGDPLSVTASIIAILQLSAKVLAYLNDVKNASRDRSQCAVEASNIHSLLTNLRFRLEAGTGSEPWYAAVRALEVENGPFDQFKSALLKLQDGMTEGGKLKMTGATLVWKFKRQETVDILNQMERLKSVVEIALQMDHFKLSEAIKNDTQFTRSQTPLIRSKIDTIQQSQDDEQRQRILTWLSPSNYPGQQSDIISRKQEGTGEWFTSSAKFTTWLHEPGATLFCPGIPGAGKTIIAATAIEHLTKVSHSGSDAVAYLFFNYKERESQNVVDLLGAITKQFLQGQPTIAKPVLRYHKILGSKGTKPSIAEMSDILQTVVSEFATTYIVVDALDECSDSSGIRHQLLAQLRNIQNRTGLQLMVTARPLPEIVAEFQTATTLEVRAVSDDVKRYVTGQLDRLPRCIQRDISLQDQIRNEIAKAIDGMFLLARLHVDSLLDKKTKKAVDSALKQLSKSQFALKDAYGDAIERIDSQLHGDSALAKRILSWITLARRPLKVPELLCAFAVEPGVTTLDPDNMLDVEDIVSVCAGLINVEEESGVVRLVHYTAQEFLESILKTWNPKAQVDITTTCLAYLSFDEFRPALATGKDPLEQLASRTFFDYAACYWGVHAHSVQTDICKEACAFLLDTPLLYVAARVLFTEDDRKYHRRYWIIPDNTINHVHVTAHFGLCKLMRLILSKMKDDVHTTINAKDRLYRTPLWFAVDKGDRATTRMLIEYGAELVLHEGRVKIGPGSIPPVGYSPLHLASQHGHTEIVELLLDKGVEVDAQNEFGQTALWVASSSGRKEVVELLLKKGASVGTKSKSAPRETPLIVAAHRGYMAIVSMLLLMGADVNACTLENSPLSAAVRKGDEQIVTMLLNAGAEVDAQRQSITALSIVSWYGRENIVRLLLDVGADVNAGPHGLKPLELAIGKSNKSIIKLLVKRGADTGGRTLERILEDVEREQNRKARKAREQEQT